MLRRHVRLILCPGCAEHNGFGGVVYIFSGDIIVVTVIAAIIMDSVVIIVAIIVATAVAIFVFHIIILSLVIMHIV